MEKLKRLDITTVTAEYLCTSCGACYTICRHHAIRYNETIGGYLFPEIDRKSCINCGLCYDVCPGVNFNKSLVSQTPDDPFIGIIISCRVGKSVNNTIFKNSQSGGIATALLTHLLEKGIISSVIVATMRSTTPPRGDVMIARTVNELIGAQKSKYLPIPMLSLISQLADSDAPVAFVGLPCHIQGLNNLFDLNPQLEKKIFIKIGLICERIQTNAVIDFFGQKATNQSIKHLIFKDKNYPRYPGNPVVTSENGENIVLDANLRMEIKDFFTPPRCRLCFDHLNIFADIVMGDPHGLKGIDRIHGETVVISRTQKGEREILAAESAGFITIRHADVKCVLNGQEIAQHRISWSGYMHAWHELGKNLPIYPKKVYDVMQKKQKRNLKKQKADLSHGINLDNFPSRVALLKAADRWLLKRNLVKELKSPIIMAIVSRLFKLTKKGFKHDYRD